ncbi:MAG: hypothetical protein JW989_00470, partial [Chlorobiaceae bacterium]|nr:hypothetical protein [Chlorobiaceae bacterium]
ILVDGFGADSYAGGNGDDLLVSIRDNSHDTLSGGSGADTFIFIPVSNESIGNDVIKDFSASQNDRIEIGGENTSVQIVYIDTNENGKMDATSILLTDDTGTSLGSVTVSGNLLNVETITLTGVLQYENALIPDSVDY